MSDDRIVFFDVETGGLDEKRHPVIQFAAVATDASTWREIEALEIKIEFDPAECEPSALEVNNWSAERWNSAIPRSLAVREIGDFARRNATVEKMAKAGKTYRVARVGAHNAEFDARFVRAMFERERAFCPLALYEPLCTLALSRWVSFVETCSPKNHQLATLCEFYGIPAFDAHDALADVRATVALARVLSSRFNGDLYAPEDRES